MTTSTLFAALFLAAAQEPEGAGPKIADIKSLTGKVTIIDAKGQTREPKMVGRRLRNGSLYDEDRIRTEADGSAEIILPDASTLTVKPGSEIQIIERQLKKPTPEGKTVGRRIRLLAGDMLTQVVPNNTVQTDFETPSGTAAVRGTGVLVTVNPATGVVTLTVVEGSIQFFGNGLSATLSPGQSVSFKLDKATGATNVQVINAAGQAIAAQAGNTQIRLGGTDQVVIVTGPNNQVQIQPVQGGVLIMDPTGTFVAMAGPVFVAIDPTLGGDIVMPFLLEPIAFDPSMAGMPLPGDGAFAFYDPSLTFFADPTMTGGYDAMLGDILFINFLSTTFTESFRPPPPPLLPTDPFFIRHEALHALVEASTALFHSQVDEDSLLFFNINANHHDAVLAKAYVDQHFHTIPQGSFNDAVQPEISYAYNVWANNVFGDPNFAFLQSHFFNGVFGMNAPYGHSAWAANVTDWARSLDMDQLAGTEILFGRILLGSMHQEFHIDKDFLYTPDPSTYSTLHGTLHNDIQSLHGALMGSDFHGFIGAFMNKVHDRWHAANTAPNGACTNFNSGVCLTSHQDFHEHLNAFHSHVHTAYKISIGDPHPGTEHVPFP